MVILENIDIDKAILQNIDIEKISNRFKFGISNRAIVQVKCTVQQCSQVPRSINGRYHKFIGSVRSASHCWVSFAWQTELWEPSELDSRWQTPTGAGQKFCL